MSARLYVDAIDLKKPDREGGKSRRVQYMTEQCETCPLVEIPTVGVNSVQSVTHCVTNQSWILAGR